MSRTNIDPPQGYSTMGPLYNSTSSKVHPYDPWSTPSHNVNWFLQQNGTRGRHSLSTTNYQEACNRGALYENAFDFTLTVNNHFQGFHAYQTKGISGGLFQSRLLEYGTFQDAVVSGPVLISIPTLLTLNLNNAVKQKVFEKIRDSDVNLGIVWGERQQSIDLIASSLTRLGRAFNLAAARNFKGAAFALAGTKSRAGSGMAIANSWLELQYGWLPLMADIFGACKTLQKQMTHQEYVIVRARKKIQDSASTTVPSGNFVDYTAQSALYESSVRVKMKSTSMLLKTASELGLTNPFLVAWELVPFSFVIDWALPLVSFISQFDSALGWHFEQGSLTTFYKRYSVKTRSVASVPSDYVYLKFSGSRDLTEIYCTRIGISSWTELYSLPFVKDPNSIRHVLNALALLTQRRGK